MKHLKDFILEGKKHIDTVSVADFYQWACAGEMPNGKADPSIINAEDIEPIIDNGWFEIFDDDDTVEAAKKAAEWFKKNWNKNIKVKSIETPNDWEVSFKLDGQEFMAAFVDYFGSFDNRDE